MFCTFVFKTAVPNFHVSGVLDDGSCFPNQLCSNWFPKVLSSQCNTPPGADALAFCVEAGLALCNEIGATHIPKPVMRSPAAPRLISWDACCGGSQLPCKKLS